MTTREVFLSTGIGFATIYRHLSTGELAGEWRNGRWRISANDCFVWAVDQWNEGRCLMFPPDRVKLFIEDFNLR